MSKRNSLSDRETDAKIRKIAEESAIDSELMAHHEKQQHQQSGQDKTIESQSSNAANAVAHVNDHHQQQAQQAQEAFLKQQAQQHLQHMQVQRQSTQSQQSQQQSQHQHQHQTHQSPPEHDSSAAGSPSHPDSPSSQSGSRPTQGSDEWHKQRKLNHKEVERRRREAINLGIKELADLIPTRDTNKTQILQRAAEYIKRLKENENNNIEKWTLEKLLTEQAVSELSASNEKLKHELERAYREIEILKEKLNNKS
ncbi:CBF1 [Candida pseudojiufengensis]|uniref:CBF1 n=1 Tax=Candida pseudojiufengensis TaxID=497109 RepID=UPI002224DDF3|nr:CBF1 [Candida pseudojiufengensis]KAI5965891.1 CBF1 [Candida pseudojiufengensis]